jgi:hypothetical protein
MTTALMYLAALLVTLALAGGIRFFYGPERGARIAGVAVPVGFLLVWAVSLRPGWMPGDDLSRLGHITLGAGLVGLVLDLAGARRLWAALAAGVVILISTWASLNGSLIAHSPLTFEAAAATLVLAVIAFMILARLDAGRSRGATALVLLAVAAFGLSAMAGVVGDARIGASGVILALAVLAYAALQAVVTVAVGDAIILGGGATLLGLAWALAHGHPAARLGLLLVPFMFFAEGTAQRVPLPKARISAILYPLVLAAVAALPVALALLVTYVVAHA